MRDVRGDELEAFARAVVSELENVEGATRVTVLPALGRVVVDLEPGRGSLDGVVKGIERAEESAGVARAGFRVVVLEQCTWHAAKQKTSPGIRAFVGSYFAAGDIARTTPLADDALAEWDGDDELFRSILPRRRAS